MAGDPSADMQFDFSVPPGTTINYESQTSIAIAEMESQYSNGAPLTVQTYGVTSNLSKAVNISGNVLAGPSAGTVEFRFCQNSSHATNTTVQQGSLVKYFKQ